MNNVEQARFNMVEQQIRPWDVLDMDVLDLVKKIKREQFVPQDKQSLAFMDLEIPLGHGAAMWSPKLEARAVQALKLKRSDNVLEIGTGTGFMTAMLSRLAKEVTSVELVAELSAVAAKTLAANHCNNVTLKVGDGLALDGDAQFDAIILGGSVPLLPQSLLGKLKQGGRLFAIVGEGAAMQAQVHTCVAPGKFESSNLFEISVQALANAPQPERFVF